MTGKAYENTMDKMHHEFSSYGCHCQWHWIKWDERRTGGQSVALRNESIARQNCREGWEDVVYGHRSLSGWLSVMALPTSGCDWHLLPAPSLE